MASSSSADNANSSAPAGSDKSCTVLLVRHGARFDFANKEAWRATCKRLDLEASDPSLSALGHAQARQTAAALASNAPSSPYKNITHILVSPYLRVLQTAQPLAHALGLPLCIEEGLAELHYTPGHLPPAAARVAYFPEVDDSYQPMHPPVTPDASSPDGVSEGNVAYLRRMLHLAARIPRRFGNDHGTKEECNGTSPVVACFSHAASVALVAALTNSNGLDEVGTFAPCGIWKLVTEDGGVSWRVAAKGDDNTGHVTENVDSTFPWGFRHSETTTTEKTTPAEWEAAWNEAKVLGPTAGN